MSSIVQEAVSDEVSAKGHLGNVIGDVLFTQREAAALMRLSTRTLERWRMEPPKGGPPLQWVRLGRRVLYRRSDILAFIEGRAFTSTSEADAAR